MVPEGVLLMYVENLSNDGAVTKDSRQGPQSECNSESASGRSVIKGIGRTQL